MKKFKFNLDALLRYRAFQEHQQKLAVAAARHDVVDCEARIEETKKSALHTEKELDTIMAKGVDAAQLQWFDHYLGALNAIRASEEVRRTQLVKTLVRQQQQLTEKTVAKKVVENLKERKKETHYQHVMRMEQQTLDDLVVLRSSRNRDA